jgi:hypothetical protein
VEGPAPAGPPDHHTHRLSTRPYPEHARTDATACPACRASADMFYNGNACETCPDRMESAAGSTSSGACTCVTPFVPKDTDAGICECPAGGGMHWRECMERACAPMQSGLGGLGFRL